MPINGEFTPEINEDFYNRLSRRISERGAQDVGRARGEALSRGLTGDPFEASAVGSARSATSNELADLDANLSYNVAGLQRQERLGKEQRGYQVEDRDLGFAESVKNRDFQERMARLGYDQQRDMEALQNRRAYQGAIANAGVGIGKSLISAGIGGF